MLYAWARHWYTAHPHYIDAIAVQNRTASIHTPCLIPTACNHLRLAHPQSPATSFPLKWGFGVSRVTFLDSLCLHYSSVAARPSSLPNPAACVGVLRAPFGPGRANPGCNALPESSSGNPSQTDCAGSALSWTHKNPTQFPPSHVLHLLRWVMLVQLWYTLPSICIDAQLCKVQVISTLTSPSATYAHSQVQTGCWNYRQLPRRVGQP